MTTQIVVFVGSLSKESINRKLAQAVVKLAPADFAVEFAEIGDLPHYNRDDDAQQADAVRRVKAQIAQADGLLFVTPEYNRSIPSVLKNVIDHGSRPYGDNSWAGKPAGILGTSPGGIASAIAQQHLRGILASQGIKVLAQPDAYLQFRDGLLTDDGQVGEGSRAFLQAWVDAFAQWVLAHKA